MEVNKKSILKEIITHLSAVLFFLLITVVFFSPEFSDGKVLSQHDVNQFKGASEDIRAYYENEGESSEWTGGMFSGMPSYQIGVWGSNPNLLHYLEMPLKALGGSTAGPVFTAMLMAYIMFLILGFKPMLSVMGAIAYAFSSYNFIILDAGHVTKAWTLAYMPIVVAGMLAMFKNKYLIGGLCMALGLAMQIKSNHLQMTYYTGIFCAILYIGLIVQKVKEKDVQSLLKSSGILAVAVALALLANASNIYSNYEMSLTSTRGKSELTDNKSADFQQTHGLDKEYVFGWSYGKGETLSLLIPNIHGGPSVTWLEPTSNLGKAMQANGYGAQIDHRGVQGYTYWGDQPGTSGPVYFGAIVCFLFLLGMIIIRNPLKWWLLGATIFFIFLAWGKNFDMLNDLMYNYFPLYTKFRAVSQALVIPALAIVIVAIWAVKESFSGAIEPKKLNKALYISVGVTGGLCLLFWLMPNATFNFTSPNDMQWREHFPAWFYNALVADRRDMLSSDAFRSLAFILISAAILWYAGNAKIKEADKKQRVAMILSDILILLILLDLWAVDKRYLGSDKFVEKRQETTFQKTPADQVILQDKDLSYRVLNLNNPFNETITSYYHRSVGGYHAAKLMRYQQLIERRLQPEMMSIHNSFQTQNLDSIVANFANLPTLNMLDTRYLIFDPSQAPLKNPYAMGNAWFVNDFKLAQNADEEIEALNHIDPRTTAVVDDKFYASDLKGYSFPFDSSATIELTAYKPNKLTYKSQSKSDQLAVFSEIYYENGWNAYVDGQLTPHFRADWTLRAMVVPAGEHEIVFKFEPTGYYTSRTVAMASSGLLILLLAGTIVWQLTRKKEE